MTTRSSWQPLDLSAVVERLREAQGLLAQAAALSAAQDAARLTGMTDLQVRLAQEREGGGDADRRRSRTYR
jgi:predicted mannosyl-3-phosphoglycerate phosphatase (HAD superfamily)